MRPVNSCSGDDDQQGLGTSSIAVIKRATSFLKFRIVEADKGTAGNRLCSSLALFLGSSRTPYSLHLIYFEN